MRLLFFCLVTNLSISIKILTFPFKRLVYSLNRLILAFKIINLLELYSLFILSLLKNPLDIHIVRLAYSKFEKRESDWTRFGK